MKRKPMSLCRMAAVHGRRRIDSHTCMIRPARVRMLHLQSTVISSPSYTSNSFCTKPKTVYVVYTPWELPKNTSDLVDWLVARKQTV